MTLSEPLWLATAAGRLFLSVILGGLVGYEREHTRRPAGFRTHILVCLGAALVMVMAEYLIRAYAPDISLDPTRLGANVISGIGFLGAGTIIRNGSSVKGLTTAASLWAVACIGLACGSGFYPGALFATGLTFLTLISLKSLDRWLARRRQRSALQVRLTAFGPDVSSILALVHDMGLTVRAMELTPPEEDEEESPDSGILIRLRLDTMTLEQKTRLTRTLYDLPSVTGVYDS